MAAVAQTFSPISGTDGRVVNFFTQAIIAGIKSWKRGSQAAMISVANFESSADFDTGTVQPNQLKGLGSNTVDIEGIYNINPGDATETGTTAITNGAYVFLDLLVSRTAGRGYPAVPGWVSNFTVTNTIENQAVLFTATITVDGVFPGYGVVVP